MAYCRGFIFDAVQYTYFLNVSTSLTWPRLGHAMRQKKEPVRSHHHAFFNKMVSEIATMLCAVHPLKCKCIYITFFCKVFFISWHGTGSDMLRLLKVFSFRRQVTGECENTGGTFNTHCPLPLQWEAVATF